MDTRAFTIVMNIPAPSKKLTFMSTHTTKKPMLMPTGLTHITGMSMILDRESLHWF